MEAELPILFPPRQSSLPACWSNQPPRTQKTAGTITGDSADMVSVLVQGLIAFRCGDASGTPVVDYSGRQYTVTKGDNIQIQDE